MTSESWRSPKLLQEMYFIKCFTKFLECKSAQFNLYYWFIQFRSKFLVIHSTTKSIHFEFGFSSPNYGNFFSLCIVIYWLPCYLIIFNTRKCQLSSCPFSQWITISHIFLRSWIWRCSPCSMQPHFLHSHQLQASKTEFQVGFYILSVLYSFLFRRSRSSLVF